MLKIKFKKNIKGNERRLYEELEYQVLKIKIKMKIKKKLYQLGKIKRNASII